MLNKLIQLNRVTEGGMGAEPQVLGYWVTSNPCKRKKMRKVRNFFRHFFTTFWQLQTVFFNFQNYGVFVWLN